MRKLYILIALCAVTVVAACNDQPAEPAPPIVKLTPLQAACASFRLNSQRYEAKAVTAPNYAQNLVDLKYACSKAEALLTTEERDKALQANTVLSAP